MFLRGESLSFSLKFLEMVESVQIFGFIWDPMPFSSLGIRMVMQSLVFKEIN